MPHIGAAMERSLRPSWSELLVRSLQPAIERRQTLSSIPGQISSAEAAFSSWDNCMQVAFCKWPVIAVIVLGGLIVLSVIWCISRCLCCGVSCCCECCYCLKCCGNCCGCCDAPKSKRHKYADDPFAPPPTQAYRSEPPMTTGVKALPKAEPPQYAEFEVDKGKGDDDSLPQMPSWEGAGSKKVTLGDEPMELQQLKKPENGSTIAGAASGFATPSPNAFTPNRSPYGTPHIGQQPTANGYFPARSATMDSYGTSNQGPAANGYFPARSATMDSYGANNQGYGQYQNNGVYGSTDNVSQGYGNQGYGMAAEQMGPGRRTPHQDWNNGQQGYPQQSRSPRPYNDQYSDQYSRSTSNVDLGYGTGPVGRSPSRGPPNNMGGGYGPDRTRSPAVPYGGYNGYEQRSRTPGAAGYDQRSHTPNNGYEQRSRTPGTNGSSRPYAPPSRQYSSDSQHPLVRPAAERQYTTSPALENNAGFDFNSGFSRPEGLNRRPTNPQQPPQQQDGTKAYPGYRAYQPQRANSNNSPQPWSGL